MMYKNKEMDYPPKNVMNKRMKCVYKSFVKGETKNCEQEFWLCCWKGKLVYEDVLCLRWRMCVSDGRTHTSMHL